MSNVGMVIKALILTSPEPITGYEITKLIKNKTGNQHQQVYRELRKIAQRDDIIVEKIPQLEKPDKKVYRFKEGHVLKLECQAESDYSKTELAYALLLNDILYGTTLYDEYIHSVQRLEDAFFKNNISKMVLEPLAERAENIRLKDAL